MTAVACDRRPKRLLFREIRNMHCIDMKTAWAARFLPSVTNVNRQAWDRLYGPASEGFDYFLACERAAPPMFKFAAAAVFDGDLIVAGAPVFRADVPLNLLLEGNLRAAVGWFMQLWPGYAMLSVLGAGSPHLDDVAMAFDPALDLASRREALGGLLDALERQAAAADIKTIVLKNLSGRDAEWAGDTLADRGFHRVAALPIATLAIPESEEAYIASLSANMRSNLRRKLKKAKNLRVEIRNSVEGVENEIISLRESTRAHAGKHYDAFEELSPTYFREVMERLGDRARLLLYWLDADLIGFAIVLMGPTRLIEKYTGTRYPQGPDNALFFLNWMTQVRMCIEHGIPEMHAGETTYLIKTRLGCKLHRSWIYFRHRKPVWNRIFSVVARWVALDGADPDLQRLGPSAPYDEAVGASK